MAIRSVLNCSAPILRQKSEKVKKISKSIQELIIDLFDTLAYTKGVGLAAPQIGVLKKVIVIDLQTDEFSERLAMINPEIKKRYGELEEYEEGCLSIPGVYSIVKRPQFVDVIYLDENNNRREIIKAEGLFARVIQHECDHLNGVLFIDRLSKDQLSEIQPKIDELIKISNLKKL